MSIMKGRKGGMFNAAVAAVVITIVVVASLTAFFWLAPKVMSTAGLNVDEFDWWNMAGVEVSEEEQAALQGGYPATDEVAFDVSKLWGGGTWSTTGNIKVYNPNDLANALETLDLDSGAAGTTTDKYTTGQTYLLYIYNDAGTEKLWTSWTVPAKAGITDTTISAPLRMFTIWDPILSVQDSTGTAYTTNDWNITTGASPGYGTGVFNVEVRNHDANTGFVSSYDPIYEINYRCCLLITVSGTGWDYISLSGDYDFAGTKGSVMYYVVELDDSKILMTQVGNVIEGGFQEIPLTAEIAAGVADSADIILDIALYSEVAWYSAHNFNFGSTYYDMSTETVTIDVLD